MIYEGGTCDFDFFRHSFLPRGRFFLLNCLKLSFELSSLWDVFAPMSSGGLKMRMEKRDLGLAAWVWCLEVW